MTLAIDKCYVVLSGKKQKIVIPNSDIKESDGVVFVRISTQPRWISQFMWSSKKRDLLCRTDVFEQIKTARTTWFDEFEASKKDEIKASRAKVKKIDASLKLTLPSIIEIDTPALGTVQSVKMRIIASWHSGAALYVELVESNLQYLKDACHYQVNNMQIKRLKPTPTSTIAQHGCHSESADDNATTDDNCSKGSQEIDIDIEPPAQSPIRSEIETLTDMSSPIDNEPTKKSPPCKRTLYGFFSPATK